MPLAHVGDLARVERLEKRHLDVKVVLRERLVDRLGCPLRRHLVRRNQLAAELEKWYHEYIRVWDTTCRRSTLERTRRCMDALADVLRGR